MNTINETFQNVDDQLQNIEAIKGIGYAKVVAFVITNYSLALGVLKVVAHIDASDEELKQALDDVGVMCTAAQICVISRYCDAVGLEPHLFDEAIADGKRIIDNANTHMEGIAL
jgi:hypothetical protein